MRQSPDDPARFNLRFRAAPRALGLCLLMLLLPSNAPALDTSCPHEGTAYVVDGTSLKAVDLATGAVTTVATGLSGARDVVVNSTGTTAFVTESTAGQVTAVDLSTGSTQVLTTGLSGVTGITIAYVFLYVTIPSTGELIQIDSTTGLQTVEATGLTDPQDVAAAYTSSIVYIVHGTAGELTAYDLEIDVLTTIAGGLSNPRSIEMDQAAAKAYVSAGSRLLEVDLTSGAVSTLAPLVSGRGVDVNRVDSVAFALDAGAATLEAVDLSTGRLTPLASGLTLATGVAVASNGCQAICPSEDLIYYTNQSGSLGWWNPATDSRSSLPSLTLSFPMGLALNVTDSRAYVTQAGGELIRVNMFAATSSTVASGLSSPRGVAIDRAETTAWVAETTSGELSAVDLSSGVVTVVASGMSEPRGIALDPGETVAYVTDYVAGSLLEVHLGTGVKTPVTTGLSSPSEIQVNPRGTTAYVDDDVLGFLSVDLSSGAISVVRDTFSADGFVVSRDGTVAYSCPTGGFHEIFLASGTYQALHGAGTFGVTPLFLAFGSPACQAVKIAPSRPSPGTGSRVATCVFLDMRHCEEVLGGYGATLTWDPLLLDYVSSMGGEPPFDTPVINEGNASSGTLSFAEADPAGAGGDQHVLCAEFDVLGGPGDRARLDLELTSLFEAETFDDLLFTARVEDITLELLGECTVGDVNSDTFLNSGDALIILSNEILLPIPQEYADLLATGCGDANGDASTDSVDANITLSWEVGLSIDPLYPVGDPIQTFDSCPSCAAGGSGPAPPLEAACVEAAPPAAPPASSPNAHLVFPPRKPMRGDVFEVEVRVDMTGTDLDLGSYGGLLTWTPRAAEFVGMGAAGPAAFPQPLLNRDETGAGRVRFAQASPRGAAGDIELARLRFRARRAIPHPEKLFSLQFSSLGSSGPRFEDLLRRMPADR